MPSHEENNSLALFSLTSGDSSSLNAATIGSASMSMSTSVPSSMLNTVDPNDPSNLDDRYSVISDSAAWSTDLITNSDSDLESNSPCKYTSTFSRTSSYQMSEYSTHSNNNTINNHYSNQQQQQQQPSLIDLTTPSFTDTTLAPVFHVSSSNNVAAPFLAASNSYFAINNNASTASAAAAVNALEIII